MVDERFCAPFSCSRHLWALPAGAGVTVTGQSSPAAVMGGAHPAGGAARRLTGPAWPPPKDSIRWIDPTPMVPLRSSNSPAGSRGPTRGGRRRVMRPVGLPHVRLRKSAKPALRKWRKAIMPAERKFRYPANAYSGRPCRGAMSRPKALIASIWPESPWPSNATVTVSIVASASAAKTRSYCGHRAHRQGAAAGFRSCGGGAPGDRHVDIAPGHQEASLREAIEGLAYQ